MTEKHFWLFSILMPYWFQGLGAYSVSKTALLGLTKVLANECAHMGVRVNCVAPGIIKTKFSGAVSIQMSEQSTLATFALLLQITMRQK